MIIKYLKNKLDILIYAQVCKTIDQNLNEHIQEGMLF
jgi:hypothetical protein